MQVYNLELVEQFSHSLCSSQWQFPSIATTLLQNNSLYKVCLLEWHDNISIENIEHINNSDIDYVLYLRCCHNYPTEIQFSQSVLDIYPIKKPLIHISWTTIPWQHIHYSIWLTMPIYCLRQEQYIFPISDNNLPKKYLYSCLSRHTRADRIANFINFYKSSYYEKSLLSLLNINDGGEFNQLVNDISYFFGESCTQVFLDKIQPILPFSTTDIPFFDNHTGMFGYDNAAYTDSYINVITESFYKYPLFVSEKVVKPLLAEQMFVMVGGKGTMQYLKEIGIDTFDDIIDHSRYDNSEDAMRIDNLHILLNEMQHYDWQNIYKNTVERRRANRDKLMQLSFETKFVNDLIDKML